MKKEKRPRTTLFMLMSLDGKISTGKMKKRDFDKDFPKIKGVKEGFHQYYDFEKQTDLVSFNSGKVMAKIGINKKLIIKNKEVSFVIIDNNNLTKKGVENLANNLKKLYLVTKNKNHPAFEVDNKNLEIIFFNRKIDFKFIKLKQKYKINKLTIQSGGTLNSILVRSGLIDRISIVVAPCVVGGKDTPTLFDGESLVSDKDLKLIKVRELNELNLVYEVKR